MAKKLGMETRSATLYVRIKPSNKVYLKKVAKEHKMSEAQALDMFLDHFRFDGKKAKK